VTSCDVGNVSRNVIPATCCVLANIRYNILQNEHTLQAWLQARVEAVTTGYELVTRISAEPFLSEPGFLAETIADAVADIHGERPVFSTTGGTSDARFLRVLCPVVEYGLINATAHKVDEQISVTDLHLLTRSYIRMIERFFQLV
jgi:succinyl-diaminopimelate desuccinylase